MLKARARAAAVKLALKLNNLGSNQECPICKWTGFQFRPLRHPRVGHANAICPQCGSNERARFAYVVMRDRLKGSERVLHFAPERSLKEWIKRSVGEYVTCDINPEAADHVVDIQNIQFPDESFDIVWCSHVLEHVEDDRKAMRELHRVLRRGGLALIQVPLWHDQTDEDASITDFDERVKRFFQYDHVRLYGDDVEDRLKEVGFSVKTIRPHHLQPEIVFRNQIAQPGNYEIFLCSK